MNLKRYWKYLPFVFITLLPFELFDKLLYQTRYRLQSDSGLSAKLWLVESPENYSPTTLAMNFLKSPDQKCLNLSLEPTKIPQCLDIDVRSILNLEDLESHASLIENFFSKTHSEKRKTFFHTTDRDLKVHNIEEAQNTVLSQNSISDQILVLIARERYRGVPIETPLGYVSATTGILNLASNILDQKNLRELNRPFRWAVGLGVCLLALWIFTKFPTSLALFLIAALSLGLWGLGLFFLESFHLNLRITGAIMAMIACILLRLSEKLDEKDKAEWAIVNEAANLKKLDELRSHFVSLVSHDLKTPLAKIKVLVEQLLNGQYGPLNPEQKFQLGKLNAAGGELKRSLSSLLLLNRVESSDLEIKKEPTDLEALLESVAREHHSPFEEKGVHLKVEKEPLFLVELDPALIKEVLHNLLDNALKFSQKSQEVHLKLREVSHCPELSPPQPACLIEVKDQGSGIPQEIRSQIFKKFSQSAEGAQDSSALKGSGLGLYLSHYFVLKHHGYMDFVTRNPGENVSAGSLEHEYFNETLHGTVFRVFIPLENPA